MGVAIAISSDVDRGASHESAPAHVNSSHTCGFTASVDPPAFVPAALLPDVVRGTFDTDEKFDLLHDLGVCSANP
jgi:hypothetical protein